MDALSRLFQAASRVLTWWVSVMPWESAIRVRCGRWVVLLRPGFHLKLPVLDLVYKQSVRMRVMNTPVQTITTNDGKTITLSAAIGYSISDIRKLYDTLHHPEDTIINLVLSSLANYVAEHPAMHCNPKAIAEAAAEDIDLASYGLSDVQVYVTDFAFVRTFRLINDQRWSIGGQRLETSTAHE